MAYSQPHPRFSTLSTTSVSSTDSPTASSARFSLQSAPSTAQGGQGPNVKPPLPPRPHIYDRHLNKTRTAEVSTSALAFLFSEVVQYTQKRVSGINDLERRCVLCACSQTELVSDTMQAEHAGVPRRYTSAGADGMARRGRGKSAEAGDPVPACANVDTHSVMAGCLRETCRCY
jgi:hypothetical protein